ncbi:MAG: Ig-like domain-containing protein [Mobilitalea sp.]
MKRHVKLVAFILIVTILLPFLSSISFATDIKIIEVKNISASVHINESYSLPKVVVATMSNKTTKKVAVKWDKKIAITSKKGTYVYKGTIKGYAKKVLLTLKVLPLTTPLLTYGDTELARGVSLGIGPYAKNGTITYQQFFQMLDVVVALADSTILPQWKQKFPEARVSKKAMRRDEGMLAIFFTAETLGTNYYEYNNDWASLHKRIGDSAWDNMSWDYLFFPGWDKPVKIKYDTWNNYMTAAYFYSMGKVSKYSDTTIFDFDPVSNSMRTADAFTYEEGLRAALRLHDSNLQPTDRIPTQDDIDILNRADKRRHTILNSKTTVTVTGTSYYVSNSGNDNNDGRSPESAWASITKINNMIFQSGDGIFFERGGLFRGVIQPKSNITYSAYGEGDKPKIYGSQENGADSKKWVLLDGTNNIWIFYKDMHDTGGIVFNEGKSWATRKTAIWDGNKYVDVIDKTTTINVKVLDNLKFYSLPDYTGFTTREVNYGLNMTGKLYLRCDKGNPGDIYNSIEFLSSPFKYESGGGESLLKTGNNCIVDNLCLMYFNSGGVYVGSYTVIQNCEIAWIGGVISDFNGAGVGIDTTAVVRSGDGIMINGTNASAINNYIHHCYDNAITIETGPWISADTRFIKNVTLKGNLTDATAGDLLICDWEAMQKNTDNKILFQNILVEDNYFMYSGYGWSHLEPGYEWGPVAGPANDGNCNLRIAYPAKAGKDIFIKNNVFYLSRYALVGGVFGPTVQPYQLSFTGNTYVQNNGSILAEWTLPEDGSHTKKYFYNNNAQNTVTNVLGDKTGVVLTR